MSEINVPRVPFDIPARAVDFQEILDAKAAADEINDLLPTYTTLRDETVAAANSAAAFAATSEWVSGESYVPGDLVWSPATGETFRALATHTGVTTDPSEDATNWIAVLRPLRPSGPSIRPTLNLQFANARHIDSRVTFTRASGGTYFDEFGTLRTAALGEPRFDHDPVTGECLGLLVEEQRTNLLTYSEQFDNAAWTADGATIAANVVTAPDGTGAADKITENTVNGTHVVRLTLATTPDATYTVSCFFKAAERDTPVIYINDNASLANRLEGRFNLGTETALAINSGTFSGASATIRRIWGGWYRCTLSGAVPVANAQIRFIGSSGLGDGTSGIYIWGAQLEEGAFPTSYIKTEASQATRAADVVQSTGTDFSEWYNQSEGTIAVSALNILTETEAFKYILSLNDGSTSNFIGVSLEPATQRLTLRQSGPGSSLTNATPIENTLTKFALTYTDSLITFCVDGGSVISIAFRVDMSLIDQLSVSNIIGNFIHSSISHNSLQYFPRALTATELQEMTR